MSDLPFDPSLLHALSDRPSLVILGHELIGGIWNSVQERIDYFGFRSPLENHRVAESRLNTFFLKLSVHYADVHFRLCPFVNTYVVDGLKQDDIETELLAINVLRPSVIVVHLSSNDLCRKEVYPPQLAQDLVDKAQKMRQHSGARIVALTSCLNRADGPSDFTDKMLDFNRALEDICAGEEGIFFHRIRGFSRAANGFDFLSIDEWTKDGFMPDPDTKYAKKFFMEVRGAALLSLFPLTDDLIRAGLLPSPPPVKIPFMLFPPPPPPGAGAAAY